MNGRQDISESLVPVVITDAGRRTLSLADGLGVGGSSGQLETRCDCQATDSRDALAPFHSEER